MKGGTVRDASRIATAPPGPGMPDSGRRVGHMDRAHRRAVADHAGKRGHVHGSVVRQALALGTGHRYQRITSTAGLAIAAGTTLAWFIGRTIGS
jgi:hypothetical protein